jgi:hypothetical protein
MTKHASLVFQNVVYVFSNVSVFQRRGSIQNKATARNTYLSFIFDSNKNTSADKLCMGVDYDYICKLCMKLFSLACSQLQTSRQYKDIAICFSRSFLFVVAIMAFRRYTGVIWNKGDKC